MEEKPLVSYEDFAKLDLRAATVLSAEKVAGADKLYKLEVDLGLEKRSLVAGIALEYSPEQLVGKKIVVIRNLQPRKLKGVESQGMLLAAGKEKPVALLTFDRPVENGETIR